MFGSDQTKYSRISSSTSGIFIIASNEFVNYMVSSSHSIPFQYLYFEGNKLTQLPTDLFVRLSNLKWLDLRNNQLTSIPSNGLAQHQSLQYLLLSRNRLRTLPYELGKTFSFSSSSMTFILRQSENFIGIESRWKSTRLSTV